MKGPKVFSLNISEEKGAIKNPVQKVFFDKKGIVGDAHAGSWHRQVSLLAKERIDVFSKEEKKNIKPGEFAENITTQGIDLSGVSLLDRFKIGPVFLEVVQIGKKCHGRSCAIFQEIGRCVMPKEGIFCRVLKGGQIRINDPINYIPQELNIKIITLSDRASLGEYEDKSGPKIAELLEKFFQGRPWKIKLSRVLIPDSKSRLLQEIRKIKKDKPEIVFTTGGTGIGAKDITPDVIRPLLKLELPGIMDFIRLKYGKNNPRALISRSLSGVLGESLIFVLPGSEKAIVEYMAEIVKILEHSIFMQKNINIH